MKVDDQPRQHLAKELARNTPSTADNIIAHSCVNSASIPHMLATTPYHTLILTPPSLHNPCNHCHMNALVYSLCALEQHTGSSLLPPTFRVAPGACPLASLKSNILTYSSCPLGGIISRRSMRLPNRHHGCLCSSLAHLQMDRKLKKGETIGDVLPHPDLFRGRHPRNHMDLLPTSCINHSPRCQLS